MTPKNQSQLESLLSLMNEKFTIAQILQTLSNQIIDDASRFSKDSSIRKENEKFALELENFAEEAKQKGLKLHNRS